MTTDLASYFKERNIPTYSQDQYGNCRHSCQSMGYINNKAHMFCDFCEAVDPDENEEA